MKEEVLSLELTLGIVRALKNVEGRDVRVGSGQKINVTGNSKFTVAFIDRVTWPKLSPNLRWVSPM